MRFLRIAISAVIDESRDVLYEDKIYVSEFSYFLTALNIMKFTYIFAIVKNM